MRIAATNQVTAPVRMRDLVSTFYMTQVKAAFHPLVVDKWVVSYN